MNVFRAAPCQNHPDREALGICIQCRAQVCSECVTKVDGINYCVRCLASMSSTGSIGATEGKGLSGTVVGLLVVCFSVLLVLMTWGMLEVVLPGTR